MAQTSPSRYRGCGRPARKMAGLRFLCSPRLVLIMLGKRDNQTLVLTKKFGIMKQQLISVLTGVSFGATGLIAYYQQTRWLLIVCSIVCSIQLILSFFEPLKDEMFSCLAVCLTIGYYLTDSIPDAAMFGICLYYATAVIFSILLAVIPLQFILIVVPIVSLVAYFINAEHLFLTTAVFCLVCFNVKHFRGKNPSFAMDVFLWCSVFGGSLLAARGTDALMSVRIIKGVLWGSAAYYIVVAIYAMYCSRSKKDE